jgi:hypothetical protein
MKAVTVAFEGPPDESELFDDMKTEIRSIGDVAYMKLGSLGEVLGNGQPRSALSESARDQAKRQKESMALFGAKSIPLTVWIDADRRTRKMTFPIGSAAAGVGITGLNMKATMTVEFYDFGSPVNIAAPSVSETVSLDDVPALKDGLATLKCRTDGWRKAVGRERCGRRWPSGSVNLR